MILLDIFSYFGRLHPLFVHLPIGFLTLAVAFDLISYKEKFVFLKPTVPLILLFGGFAAALSCVLGWLLSESGEYDFEMLQKHKYIGILLTVGSFILYFLNQNFTERFFKISAKTFSILMLGQTGLLIFTGHQGGSLTHGKNYLSLSNISEKQREKPKNIEKAMVFEDLVMPILEEKCVQCHKSGKNKGHLLMESYESLLKGGKHGSTVVAGDTLKSEIYRRVTLSSTHKEFMPADGKTPLTKEEIEIIAWWINDANAQKEVFATKVSNFGKMKQIVMAKLGFGEASLTNRFDSKMTINEDIPKKIDKKALEQAINAGFTIRFMYKNPDMLDVSFMDKTKLNNLNIKVLEPLMPNIIWLNLAGLSLDNSAADLIRKGKNIEKLRLENNNLSDIFLSKITDLAHLNSINLNHTKITIDGIEMIKKMKSIKNIYVWETSITASQIEKISKDSTLKIIF